MRKKMQVQMLLEQTSIEELFIDLKCRDDIPAILKGLQTLYINIPLRERILKLLSECISKNASLEHGRPGMDLWQILVLGVLRVAADLDYDRLHDLANAHFNLRVMLLTGGFLGEKWTIETIKENVSLLTPETLDQINLVVVEAGHALLKKKGEKNKLNGRCDSFVVETDVHFPTDISLLYDAIRTIVKMMMWLENFENIEGWRQGKHHVKKMKKLIRKIGALKKSIQNGSKGKSSEKKASELARKQEELIHLHRDLVTLGDKVSSQAEQDLTKCRPHKNKEKAENFLVHAKRQCDQIQRRVINGETIPAEEKVYSVFEPHTEWISKGKAGVAQELGLRVSIFEDQHGFILNHIVMEKQTDDKVAVAIVQATKAQFPNLTSCSFDKGYHSPQNKIDLSQILDEVILPKKGKLNAIQLEEETSESFVKGRNQHSAVESAINCLEHHGLSRCFDHGIDGFKRHVSLAIVGKNIYQLGRLILAMERKKEKSTRLLIAS